MKRMTDKQKRIIAYIIAIWFAIFGTLGMVQTGLNIANCAGRKKETRKAYAVESAVIESTTFRFNLGGIYTTTTSIPQRGKKRYKTGNNKTTKKYADKKINIAIMQAPHLYAVYYNGLEFELQPIGGSSTSYRYVNLGDNTDSPEPVFVTTLEEGYVLNTVVTNNAKITVKNITDYTFTLQGISTAETKITITTKEKTTPPTETTVIEQSTQQIEFIFTANSITIQIYNANRETTYIGNWQGTTEEGWNSTIGSYNTKPINEPTISQREGFTLHLSPQKISNLSGQIQPTYIPTKAEITVYENQIKFKFGLASTTEESEYIQIQINKSDPAINFIPENTVFQNSLNTTGYTQGYQDGFKQGEQEKEIYGITQYNKGKQDGIANANKYTFKGLISAVFDVPIQTLYGMLDFNILGINILSLVMSIVSVILLIAIVKVLL